MIRIFTNTAMCEDGDTYMVSGGQGAVWSANSSTSILQSLKSLLLLVSTLIGIPHRERRSGANIQEKSPRGPSVCLDAAKKKVSRCRSKSQHSARHTDIQQDCAIELLVHNVVRQNLIVQGLWIPLGARHRGDRFAGTKENRWVGKKKEKEKSGGEGRTKQTTNF